MGMIHGIATIAKLDMPVDETASQRLKRLGITLPPPMPMADLPFQLVRVHGDRAILSGHVPLDAEGRLARPVGKVGAEVSEAQAVVAARQAALSLLASLEAELGSLDRVQGWLRVFGMVNAAPGFNNLTAVINGASTLILDVFGTDRGAHARSAVGMAELPMSVPVEIEAEVAIKV